MNAQVLCLGGAHVDLVARCQATALLADSNPVSMKSACGGVAHNIAQNLTSLGRAVSLVSAVGADAGGAQVVSELRQAGIGHEGLLTLKDQQTGCYTSVLDESGDLLIGLACMDIYEELRPERFLPHVLAMNRVPVWVMDSNLPKDAVEFLCEHADEKVKIFAVAVSAAKVSRLSSSLAFLDGIFLNALEASVLLKCDIARPEQALCAAQILQSHGLSYVFLTLGAQGVAVSCLDFHGFFPAFKVQKKDVNGAGDAFAATVIDGLLGELSLNAVVNRALIAASIAVETKDCSYGMLSPQKLLEAVS